MKTLSWVTEDTLKSRCELFFHAKAVINKCENKCCGVSCLITKTRNSIEFFHDLSPSILISFLLYSNEN